MENIETKQDQLNAFAYFPSMVYIINKPEFLKNVKKASKRADDSFSDFGKTIKNITAEMAKFVGDTKELDKLLTGINSPAEKYLASQKIQQGIQSRINEFKAKSGFLDVLSLQFKEQELELQKKISYHTRQLTLL